MRRLVLPKQVSGLDLVSRRITHEYCFRFFSQANNLFCLNEFIMFTDVLNLGKKPTRFPPQ